MVSRNADLTKAPAVVTIGTINGGSRTNLVLESVQMVGTLRVFDKGVRDQMHRDINSISEKFAEGVGAPAMAASGAGFLQRLARPN